MHFECETIVFHINWVCDEDGIVGLLWKELISLIEKEQRTCMRMFDVEEWCA